MDNANENSKRRICDCDSALVVELWQEHDGEGGMLVIECPLCTRRWFVEESALTALPARESPYTDTTRSYVRNAHTCVGGEGE